MFVLKMGIVVKGGGAVVGNAIANQVPKAAAAMGAGAGTMTGIGRGVAIFTHPGVTAVTLGFAIPAVFAHCEITCDQK